MVVTSRCDNKIGGNSAARGSKYIRATLNFSPHHHVLPRIMKVPLKDAGKVLNLMHSGKLRNRGVR